MIHRVHVRAPCRLHFGMFSFGRADTPQFGGVGVMIEPPAVEVTLTAARSFAARGPLAYRVEHFAAMAAQSWRLSALPCCEIHVASPPDHRGLGVGTQLGLSVAAGLRRFLGLPESSIAELAQSIGRSARSSVGTYGFQHGGLIVDAGKQSPGKIGQLARRAEVPATWRCVVVRRAGTLGLAGDQEADAFSRLPPVSLEVTRQLWRLTNEDMLPALERADYVAFGEAVYQFGRLAGECFAAVQGGPFASSETAALVEAVRVRGVPGVGQSSWGPTVFAITETEADARWLAVWLRRTFQLGDDNVVIARPNNRGATIEVG
jgi:beta-RFAP synthase